MGWNLATDKAFREKAEYGHLEKGKKEKKERKEGKKEREKVKDKMGNFISPLIVYKIQENTKGKKKGHKGTFLYFYFIFEIMKIRRGETNVKGSERR